MLPDAARAALDALVTRLAEDESETMRVHDGWRRGRLIGLSAETEQAARLVDRALRAWTESGGEPSAYREAFADGHADLVFLWCAANAPRSDTKLAPLLAAALARPEHAGRARVVAKNRVVQGPLEDALRCVPLLGSGRRLADPEHFEAAARLEILLWEAGARALEAPELGRWVWSDADNFEAVVGHPARGSLRGRVLAARCLEVSVCGISPTTDPALVGRALQVLQPLLLHPEPLVWVHAARCFGRLAGAFEPLEGTLLDWSHGATLVLRQRALTAFASLPAERLAFLGHQLESIIDAPENEAWVLAAAAAATPYLFHERRDLWDRLAHRILAGDGGAVACRALARGIAPLFRRGDPDPAILAAFGELRELARQASAESVADHRRWLETIAVTDPLDGAERDPLDLELGLENLVRLAAHYDDEEADIRAARFAAALGPTFEDARRIVLGDHSLRRRASAMNALEGCARSLALRLWGPMLATRPQGEAVEEPELEETFQLLARAPMELLDEVRDRRAEGVDDEEILVALETLALKLGGYALDACGGEHDLGPGRGPTAHATCRWLRKLEGLGDDSRELPPSLASALSSMFWRLVDTTRGSALGEIDDVKWLGPFAAWWALVIDRPAMLRQLGHALPMIADGVLERCAELAAEVRAAIVAKPADGAWGEAVAETLAEFSAEDTELAEALVAFASGLADFAEAKGGRNDLEGLCLKLVLTAERVQAALADPVRGLHSAQEAPRDDSLARRTTENAPRMASVVARAIRGRQLALLDIFFASLGPITSGLVEAAVKQAMSRTPPPPPVPKKKEPKTIVGYELIKPLGEGGIGSVWLVRKPGADRYFVLKIPKVDVLESASETEREGILASFVEEAKALAGLYHPNVANIIDRGVEGDVPYLVLDYLIGADLKEYSSAALMSLFELRRVVLETCAGLTALHGANLVHRDIKPANIWLRLPLAGGERFDPEKHRDPARAQPLTTVIIDFGMVRANRVSADVGGRFVAGTPGYIAPEQVLDPVELDGRADVYALAGTIFNVTTGRTFFDEMEDPRQRIVAHMNQDPLEDPALLASYPAALAKLMRAATTKDPRDRPTPAEFGRAFADLL